MDNKKLIGMRINSALAKKGVKQKELAQQIGVTDNTISYFCSGSRTPNIEMLISIARALNVSSDYLLGLSDVITPDTTAQAVIAYTGLSEDNVLTLHHAKENATNPVFSNITTKEFINIDGSKPYLDCLNDLLDAIYSKKNTIIRDFILIQYYADWIAHYDPQYFSEEREIDLYTHGHTSVPITTFIEHRSISIGRAIEKYLIEKYTATNHGGD